MTIDEVKNNCCGCGACVARCPVGAIQMLYSDDGFLYPSIDKKKCVKCGMCKTVCPSLESSFAPVTFAPVCYAVFSNKEIAMASSSGGVFSLLAAEILKNEGYVCGAAFDKDWSVKHIIISSADDLEKLRVSKYVQSNTGNVFTEIKKLLDDKKLVLFSGTPCQVAGLYGFLGKRYENLLTCDIFCHGAPSPIVWKRYLQDISNGRDIVGINFRDKSNLDGTAAYNITFKFSDDSVLSVPYTKDLYMNGFLKDLYIRKSCSMCKFAQTSRKGDISLGDFWGYNAIDKKRDVSQGISAVLINTDKGMNIFEKIKTHISFIKPVDIASIVSGNPILSGPFKPHKNRERFMKEMKESKECISDIIKNNLENKDVAILNFSSKSDNNYGASLVGYAMECAIKRLGYNPSTVCFIPDRDLYEKSKKSVFWDFQQNFLNLTGICTNKEILIRNINYKFDKFIIGSDQIIRHPWHSNFVYYLDWVRGKKSLLAYAPSFGIDSLGMDRRSKKYAKKCLKRFDALSVREHTGAEIFQKEFGMKNIPVVCDPTLLLTAEDYQPIIEKDGNDIPEKEYVAYYLLDASTDTLKELGKKYPLIDAYRDENGNFRTIGQWLNILKNAKYVVTDSFHGTVFSMIFKRQFITLTTLDRGNDRIDTLMKLVGSNRLIDSKQVVDESRDFSNNLDYKEIDKNILNARLAGLKFLQQALEIAPSQKQNIMRLPRFKLLGLVPLFSIRKNKGYIFRKIEIGKITD